MKKIALEMMAEKVREIDGQRSLDEYEVALREIAPIAQIQYEQEESNRPPWRRPRRFATVQDYRDQ